jgi:hypothetical protein
MTSKIDDQASIDLDAHIADELQALHRRLEAEDGISLDRFANIMLCCAVEIYIELAGANARTLIVSEVDDTITAMGPAQTGH